MSSLPTAEHISNVIWQPHMDYIFFLKLYLYAQNDKLCSLQVDVKSFLPL